MKKITYLVAALAAVCSCQKNELPGIAEAETVTIAASSSVGDANKISMGAKTATAYPMSWNAEEHAYLREVALPEGGAKETTTHYVSSSFSKKDAHSATFTFNVAAQSIVGTYDYVSVYPCHPTKYATALDNGVRHGGSDQKNKCSYNLSYTRPQVPTATGPDDSTHIYWAKDLGKTAQATSVTLNYESVVSYGKMTLTNFPALTADETPSRITVTAPLAQKMTGRMFHYFHDASDGHKAGDVVPFSNTSVMNYVLIDPKNISFNTKGFDVWFTTFPIKLAAGDSLTCEVKTNKNTYTFVKVLAKAVDFTAGRVSEFTVNYSKCITPYKTLTFDFSTYPAGWPDQASYQTTNDKNEYSYDYVLGGVTYKFSCAPCNDLAATSTRSIAWGFDGKNSVEYFVAQSHRFLGLPVIEGYKLVTFKFTQILAAQKTARQACITNAITAQKAQSTACVTGGEAKAVNVQNAEFAFNLTSTMANTRYYFAPCVSASGFKTITLVYQKVD